MLKAICWDKMVIPVDEIPHIGDFLHSIIDYLVIFLKKQVKHEKRHRKNRK